MADDAVRLLLPQDFNHIKCRSSVFFFVNISGKVVVFFLKQVQHKTGNALERLHAQHPASDDVTETSDRQLIEPVLHKGSLIEETVSHFTWLRAVNMESFDRRTSVCQRRFLT